MIGWLIALLGIATALKTAASFSQRWWLALASHFRPHLIASGLIFGILVLFTGVPGWVKLVVLLLCIASIVANALAIWESMPSKSMPWSAKAADEGGPTIRIAYANLLKDNKNHTAVIDWVLAEQPDIFIASEALGPWADALTVALVDSFPHGTKAPLGDLMIFSRRPLGEVRHPVSRYGHALITEIDTEAGKLAILGVHTAMPRNERYSTGRDAMIETLGHIAWRQPEGIVVIGDFNAAPWSRPIRRLMTGGRLAYGPGAWIGTWPAYIPDWAGIPIDLVMAGGGWRVAARQNGPRIGSDHRPVLAEIMGPKKPVESAS
jgi:endonuclease/exonuclease/phosphatase (EEP) superfamily protein YafD